MLAYLRKGETFAELAAGFGVGRTAAWRYVDEVVALAAARAPKLRAPGERANAQLKTWREFSVSCATAPGGRGNSPKPSTYCSFARPNQDGISSMKGRCYPARLVIRR